jgi:hypothetical protein
MVEVVLLADMLSKLPALLGYASDSRFYNTHACNSNVSHRVDLDRVRGGEGGLLTVYSMVLVHSCEKIMRSVVNQNIRPSTKGVVQSINDLFEEGP